jgi:hypothetical protein
MDAPRAGNHLDANQNDGGRRRQQPQQEIGEGVGRRVRQQPRLNARGEECEHAGRGDRHGSVTAKLDAARHLAADRRDIGQRLFEIRHDRLSPSFAIQSTLAYKL